MNEKFITITGFNNYYGREPFAIGNLVRCKKEPKNSYDSEAIRCLTPGIGTVGYIANSPKTVAGGTMSAGRIYDTVDDHFYVRVMFTTFTKIICLVEDKPLELLDEEFSAQLKDDWCSGPAITINIWDKKVY